MELSVFCNGPAPIESKILALLSQNVGRVLTHFAITKKIGGETLEGDVASLRVPVATLRKKLEKEGDGEEYIRTHVGIGYCMIRKSEETEKLVK